MIHDKIKNIILSYYIDNRIKNINKVIYCNSEGFFSTPKLNYGKYILEFQSLGFISSIDTINLNQTLVKINKKTLKENNYDLSLAKYTENKLVEW